MSELRDRDWSVTVDRLRITGLDIQFEVVKGVSPGSKSPEPNSCSLQIWNLNPESRRTIEALSLKPRQDGVQSGNIRVEVEAGYKTTGRTLLFRGDLRTAVSRREGPDVVTSIEGEDGGRSVLRARIAQSFPPGTDLPSVVRSCANAMGVGVGNLTDVTASIKATYPNGVALFGPAPDALRNALRGAGLVYTVQNGVLQIQRPGQPLNTKAVLLKSGSGLVGSPERDANGVVTATCLIIPELIPGGKVVFDTLDLKGAYQIKRITYTGDTYGNDWFARVECKGYT